MKNGRSEERSPRNFRGIAEIFPGDLDKRRQREEGLRGREKDSLSCKVLSRRKEKKKRKKKRTKISSKGNVPPSKRNPVEASEKVRTKIKLKKRKKWIK